jgi:hypothetical protein
MRRSLLYVAEVAITSLWFVPQAQAGQPAPVGGGGGGSHGGVVKWADAEGANGPTAAPAAANIATAATVASATDAVFFGFCLS